MKNFETQAQFERLQNAKNAVEERMFAPTPEAEIKVQIFPDKSVSPAKFIPNKTMPGTYRAHPVTIRAMRQDLFAGANNELFADLEYNIKCDSCKSIIDVQFWKFCPYCEKSFPKDLPNPLNSHEV
jgi:hypothetical protein